MNDNNENKIDAMLPPPELLARYKDMGLGDNLIDLVKDEQKHRHSLQKKYWIAYILGQFLGFIIVIFFLKNIFSLIKDGLKQECYILTGIFCLLITIVTIVIRRNKLPKRVQQSLVYTQSRRNIRSTYPMRRNSSHR